MKHQGINLDEIYLRDDLEFIVSDTGRLQVKDPLTHNFFVIEDDEEAQIIQLLQQLNVQAVIDTCNIEESKVFALVQGLAQYNLLRGNDPTRNKPMPELLPFLKMRATLFNPDPMLEKVEARTRWIDSLPMLILWSVLLIKGLMVWTEHHSDFVYYGWPLLADSWLISLSVFLAVLFIILILHEFVHGIFLKRYGGDVPEIGFSFVYGIPSIYSDITDVYQLKGRKKKLIVVLAGPIFQAIVGVCSFILWSIAIPQTFIADFLWLTSFAAFFSFFINLNPLIKLDGYYALQFALREEDLFGTSIDYWKAWLSFHKPEGITISKHILYFLYAPLSILYTVFLLLWLFGFYLQTMLILFPTMILVIYIAVYIYVNHFVKREYA